MGLGLGLGGGDAGRLIRFDSIRGLLVLVLVLVLGVVRRGLRASTDWTPSAREAREALERSAGCRLTRDAGGDPRPECECESDRAGADPYGGVDGGCAGASDGADESPPSAAATSGGGSQRRRRPAPPRQGQAATAGGQRPRATASSAGRRVASRCVVAMRCGALRCGAVR